MGYVLSLDLDEALDLIDYAADQKMEELLFSRWISDLHLTMSFDEFKRRLRQDQEAGKTSDEILADVRDILSFERGPGLGDI